MKKPRSEKLQPEYVLASGERLKLMAAQGYAIAKAAWAQPSEASARESPQSEPSPPMTAFKSGLVKGYMGPNALELIDLMNAMNEEEEPQFIAKQTTSAKED